MKSSRFRVLAAAVLFGALATGAARANDARVPLTGSSQGEIVPNALPGGGLAHVAVPEGHLVAPSGQSPRVGSAQGIQPPNSVPGAMASSGEAQPHSDVTSPTGLVPNSNRAPRQPGAR